MPTRTCFERGTCRQEQVREERQVLEPGKTALLSVRFSCAHNPSSQAHTLNPMCDLPLLKELMLQNPTKGPAHSPRWPLDLLGEGLVMTGAKSSRGGALLGAIIHPCSARPCGCSPGQVCWGSLGGSLTSSMGTEQSQNPPQPREGHARQSWCPGQAGGRSKHRTQAGLGAGSTGRVTASCCRLPHRS